MEPLWRHEEIGLVFDAPKPGRLLIRYNGSTFCIIEGQETFVVDSSPLNRVAEPWIKLYPNDRSHEGPFAFLHVASEINYLHHGGLLVVVPEASPWQQSIKPPMQYASKRNFDWIKQAYEDISVERVPVQAKQGKKPSWWNYLLASTQDKHVFYEALRVIARLSAVDGAVIVSPEFRVLGFGATLQPRHSERVESVNIVEMKGDVPPRVEKPITAFRGGTRHQSAAQFAMDQPESVVFVVSQDGVVSLMTDGPNKQQVSVYRHLEYM